MNVEMTEKVALAFVAGLTLVALAALRCRFRATEQSVELDCSAA